MITTKELQYVDLFASKIPMPGIEYSLETLDYIKRCLESFNEKYKGKEYSIIFSNGDEIQLEIQSKNRIKFGRRKRYIQKAIAVISAVTIFVIVKYVCIQNLTMLVYVYWFQLCGGIYAVLQSRKVK